MSGIDLTIENLKNQLRDLEAEISQKRKKGVDMSIARLRILDIPGKIGLVEVTKDFADAKKVMQKLEDVKKEIEAAEPPVKQEYVPSAEDKLNTFFQLGHAAVLRGDLERAKEHYQEMQKLYEVVSSKNKKESYKKCVALLKELQHSEHVAV